MIPGKNHIGVGCGALIINEKEEVLLVKRSLKARTEPEYWSRPGGEVCFGEKIEDAVKREVREETGLEVEVLRFLEMTEMIDPTPKTHWITFGYLAGITGGTLENKEPDKHEEVRWFPLTQLPGSCTQYSINSLNAYRTFVLPKV